MKFKENIIDNIYNQNLGLKKSEIEEILEIPPDDKLGDFAFPCFKLASLLKTAPQKISLDLAEKLKSNDNLFEIKSVGAYVNFFINEEEVGIDLKNRIDKFGEDYGNSNYGKNEKIIVEFSSTNIAKPFHIGHIRSTVIGNALNNIYKSQGYDTVRINYLGDYGTQFGMMISAYKKWGDINAINENPIQELLKLYVRYNKEAEEDENLMEEARYWFEQLENKNQEALKIWQLFKDLSLEEFLRVYKMLNIEFDSYDGEYYNSQFIPSLLEELKNKNLLEESEGAMIINLEKYNLPPALIVKSNGSSTYITRDIATAINRKKVYDFKKNLYVVASQQNLHFQQLKAIIELMGYEWYKDCIHIPFGMVSMKDGAMKTRTGKVIFLEDVLNKSIEKTKDIIEDRKSDILNKDEISRDVGIGAVIFQELFNGRIKDYVFDWDILLNFDGETGPYVQYTHARASSVLRKTDFNYMDNIKFSEIETDEEKTLLKNLYKFNDILINACEKNEPYILTRYLVDISKNFNKFYNSVNILNSYENNLKIRLFLTYVSKIVLSHGLKILGIKSPDRM